MFVLYLITLCVNTISSLASKSSSPPCKSYNDANYYPTPENCMTFYQCSLGTPILKACGPGTAWDQQAQLCNLITLVANCPNANSETTPTLSTKQFTSKALEIDTTTTESVKNAVDGETTQPPQVTTSTTIAASKFTTGTIDVTSSLNAISTTKIETTTTESLTRSTERNAVDGETTQPPQVTTSTTIAAPNFTTRTIDETSSLNATGTSSNASKTVKSSIFTVSTTETQDIAFHNSEGIKNATSPIYNRAIASIPNEGEDTSLQFHDGSTLQANTTSNSTIRCTTNLNESVTIQSLACDCNASRNTLVNTEKLENIISELKIDVKSISSSRRKLTSAPDSRPSAIGVGLFGTLLLVTVVTAIVSPDVLSFINNVLIVRKRSISHA